VPPTPGISREDSFVVDAGLLTNVGGLLAVRVLSTPRMIAMMERNASILAQEHLPDGKATVGFEVCIKHVAGALEGARCTSRAVLREVVDARKLRFDVEVREGERTIGVGTHERRVVDVETHAGSAGRRSGASE
jgi:fluoroacetyl-CoA thioesterase